MVRGSWLHPLAGTVVLAAACSFDPSGGASASGSSSGGSPATSTSTGNTPSSTSTTADASTTTTDEPGTTAGPSTSSTSAMGTETTDPSSSSGVVDGWLPPSQFRKPIQIHPHVDLQAFTVGIIIPMDQDLDQNARADGRDLAFTSADGTSVLPFEIESYRDGELAAWVLVPQLFASTDTTIYMYYGSDEAPAAADPAATWPAERYAGVWHMVVRDDSVRDSTANANDATAANGDESPSLVAGIAGRAAAFDGIDDSLSAGDPGDESLDFAAESFGVSVWVNVSQNQGDFDSIIYKGGANGPDVGYGMFLGLGSWVAGAADGMDSTLVTFGQEAGLVGDWHHLAIIFDRERNALRCYVDGLPVESQSLASIESLSSDLPFQIGRGDMFHFRDLADEVRVYKGVESDARLEAEFANLRKSDEFFSVGAAERR